MNTLLSSESDLLENSPANLSSFLTESEKIALNSEYIQQNITAYKQLQNASYFKSAESYKKCLRIAVKLGDLSKQKESRCNYGVCLYYNGDVEAAREQLEAACGEEKVEVGDVNSDPFLRLKILSNLSLLHLSSNKINDFFSVFTLILNQISSAKDKKLKEKLLKKLLMIYFKSESLIDLKFSSEEEAHSDEKVIIEEKESASKKSFRRIIGGFFEFLESGDIAMWNKALKDQIDVLKSLKDYTGVLFALLNIYSSDYVIGAQRQNKNLVKNSKADFLALIRLISEEERNDQTDFEAERMIEEYYKKLEAIRRAYKCLYKIEEGTKCEEGEGEIGRVNQSRIYTELLLKYILAHLNQIISNQNLYKQISSHIELCLKLLKTKETYYEDLDLSFISPAIYQSMNQLFVNLMYIYEKSMLKRAIFRLKIINDKLTLHSLEKKVKNLNNYYLEGIKEGDVLIKINYGSNGTKNHFYTLDTKKNALVIYDTQEDRKSYSEMKFLKIKKILYGIKSANLIKKINLIPNTDQPFLFLTFVLKNKTLDLLLTEINLKKWLYGLQHYLSYIKMKYKIMSCTNFIVSKAKMKMIYVINNSQKEISKHVNSTANNFKPRYDSPRKPPKKLTFIKALLLYKDLGKI